MLCRIRRQCHVDHDLLLQWMCGPRMSVNFGASVWALCTLISQVPVRDRLRRLNHLLTRVGFRNLRLAAVTLSRLADMSGFQNLVAQTLADWVEHSSSNRKCAAVEFYRYRFGLSDLQLVLDQLTKIARDKSLLVHGVTVGTVLGLMRLPDTLGLSMSSG